MAETTRTVSQPWDAQANALQEIYNQGRGLYQQPLEYYPGQTYAGFAPAQEMAMGLTQQRALQGSPYQQAYGGYLNQALSQPRVDLRGTAANAQGAQGGLAPGMAGLASMASSGPNPYLDAMYGAASRGLNRNFNNTVAPSINATFGGGGRTGSAAHQNAMNDAGQRLMEQQGDMAANLYGGQYQSDMNRRLQASQDLTNAGFQGINAMNSLYGSVDASQRGAAGLAPAMQQMEYNDLDRLFNVGAQQRNLAQTGIQDSMNRYDYYQNQPWNQLERYNALVGGRNWGGSQTTTSPGPQWYQVLGGLGAMGLGAYGAFSGGAPQAPAQGAG